jgi:hypothetical protein
MDQLPDLTPMAIASPAFLDLAAKSNRELEEILRRGTMPSVDALVGHEYRGFNRPARTALLGIRKFTKGFFEAEDEAIGFNMLMKQNGLDGQWIPRGGAANPRRLGFFSVAPVQPGGREDLYPRALLLDYAAGHNPVYDPSRLLRDYVVRVREDSDDLLLGKAYVALGAARVAAGFFVLERHRPLTSAPALPASASRVRVSRGRAPAGEAAARASGARGGSRSRRAGR